MNASSEEMVNEERYLAAAHAMQTGVALEMAKEELLGGNHAATNQKHLRVGINSSFVSQAGLVKLLVDKGVITESEYVKYQADAMEDEVKRYEARLPGVTLG